MDFSNLSKVLKELKFRHKNSDLEFSLKSKAYFDLINKCSEPNSSVPAEQLLSLKRELHTEMSKLVDEARIRRENSADHVVYNPWKVRPTATKTVTSGTVKPSVYNVNPYRPVPVPVKVAHAKQRA